MHHAATLSVWAIFICSCSPTVKTKEIFQLSKEITNVEHEYMNIAHTLNVAARCLLLAVFVILWAGEK